MFPAPSALSGPTAKVFGSGVKPNGVTCASTLPSSRLSFQSPPPNAGTQIACLVRTA